MAGMFPGGNSMSTTAPVTRAMRPVAVAGAEAVVVMFVLSKGSGPRSGAQAKSSQRSVRPDPARASAPPTISVISCVISA